MPETLLLFLGVVAGYYFGFVSGRKAALLNRLPELQRLRVEAALMERMSPWLLAGTLGLNCVGLGGMALLLGLAGPSFFWLGILVWMTAMAPLLIVILRRRERIIQQELQRIDGNGEIQNN